MCINIINNSLVTFFGRDHVEESHKMADIGQNRNRSPIPSTGGGASFATLAALAAEQEYRELSNSDLSDKIVLIYGATADVAAATAVRLSKHGAQLVLVDIDRNQSRLTQLATNCDQSALHGNRWQFRNKKWQRVQKAMPFTVDEMNGDVTIQLSTIINTVIENFGRIDSFIFKSTISYASAASKITDSEAKLMTNFDQVITAELIQFVRLVQLLLPFLEQSQGNIVNLSTTVALKPDCSCLNSAIVRSSIDMLVKCLSLELGPRKIRINSINHILVTSPSAPQLVNGLEVNQSMMDQYLQQIGGGGVGQADNQLQILRPSEVASTVLYLITPRSSFLNGINLVVDGGKTL